MNKKKILLFISILLITLPYFINIYSILRILSFTLGVMLFSIILFMSKKTYFLNSIIIITILVSASFVDYFLSHYERIPFIAKKVVSSEKVTTYYSFFYQINVCGNNQILDKFYQKGYTCDKFDLEEITVNNFLSTYEKDKRPYLKIKGKVSAILSDKYIELNPYEINENDLNGNVTFQKDIVLRLPIKDLNLKIDEYKIYDEIEFIGRVKKEKKETEKNIYLFTDVIILPNNLYKSFEIIVENDDSCKFDKTSYVETKENKYYTSCLKNIDIRFNEENVYDLDYVLLDEKITLKKLIDLNKEFSVDENNNYLYKLNNLNIIVCNNNEVILGKNINFSQNYCSVEEDIGV